jgi:NADH:ubiquinone oxidoreductase subunit F (NADH-binding)/Pyruvate/2-oxoacid:ferredoxin oxidoreductase delta subunit/NADH:ubiquinone oxidoreductase subunit E
VATLKEFENLELIPAELKGKFLSKVCGIDADKLNETNVAEKMAELRNEKIDKPIIFVGAGTCGLAAGAQATLDKIDAYLKANSIDAEVAIVGCIGLCTAEPMVDIQLPGKSRLSFQNITNDKVDALLEGTLKDNLPIDMVLGQFEAEGNQEAWKNIPLLNDHPFFKQQKRCVLANCGVINPVEIDQYIAKGGYSSLLKSVHTMTPQEVCDEVEESGLRGRGGGGFPSGKKWKFALNTDADQKYMVCNADEGDPGAFMDRAVCEGDPHKLLEGLAIAAYGIGASKAYIYIRGEYPLAIENLKAAITQAENYGLLGENIFNSGFSLEIVLKIGAGAFVCGEETALIHSIEGKRGMPRPRPPFPAVSGLFGKPTVINNVETLANVAPIIANGAKWFNAMGTERSPGTKVFALSGKVKRAGLVEIPMGTSIKDIVFTIGGGIENDEEFKAVQIGGPSGGCIPSQHIDLEVDYESLKEFGAMIGSGGLVVMDEKTCMVDVAKFFMGFIQRESCGKCIPCREGTRVMLEILESICRGRRSEENNDSLERFKGVLHLERLANVIRTTSLCGLGQTAPNPVLSTLNWFRNEYEAHVYDRKCPAGVCNDLLTYVIDEEACKGCTACIRKCPVNAITGERKAAHVIDENLCIGCGACFDTCKFGAINIS